MKRFLYLTMKLVLLGLLCAGLLIGCDDDDDNEDQTVIPAIAEADPSMGYVLNATSYWLKIDIDSQETFDVTLTPGQLLSMDLQEDRAHVFHVVVMNSAGRVVGTYYYSFHIDIIPLNNQLLDFKCNWFVEFTPVYPELGFANRFGS